ncbi:MAG TPA: SCO family protein [Bdellovibrionota bacterium]|nr:SCO family protein [Bdellovibrionota bacterium]
MQHRVRASIVQILGPILALGLSFSSVECWAVDAPGKVPGALQGVGIRERLGAKVDIESIHLRDESGKDVVLGDFFHSKRPVLLSVVYYECPGLCGFVLNGMIDGLKAFSWTPGKEFEVVTVSMDSREGPELAAKKKASVLGGLGRPDAAAGWHFLTGSEEQVRRLTNQVGFDFKWDAGSKQFAHQAGIFVLTPSGMISRVLFGIEYPPRDLRLSLIEAGEGKTGSLVDQVVLFCFRYDPSQRGYSLYVLRLVQLVSAFMTLAVGAYLAVFWKRQRRSEPVRGSAV